MAASTAHIPYESSGNGGYLISPQIVITYPNGTSEAWNTSEFDLPPKYNGTAVDKTGASGEPLHFAVIPGFRDGSATLIVEGQNESKLSGPTGGAANARCYFPDPNAPSETVTILTVGNAKTAGAYRTIPITFRANVSL